MMRAIRLIADTALYARRHRAQPRLRLLLFLLGRLGIGAARDAVERRPKAQQQPQLFSVLLGDEEVRGQDPDKGYQRPSGEQLHRLIADSGEPSRRPQEAEDREPED